MVAQGVVENSWILDVFWKEKLDNLLTELIRDFKGKS